MIFDSLEMESDTTNHILTLECRNNQQLHSTPVGPIKQLRGVMVDDQIKWVEIVFSPEIELYSEYLNNFFIMIKS